ncbi:MAG TPA: aminotransferase class V-fold PLP-dependent enzyme [Candidatus Limnocylindria bacterium]|nr:aminotransferase class V-fold PLP-dependent enzyme [Candidatus Limnocylindria bacterium]
MIGLTYLNYASIGLLPVRSALAGIPPFEVGGLAFMRPLFDRHQDVRAAVARWLGATERNIAFLGSTTAALQAVARTFDWKEGDVVLYPKGDYPANVLPWTDLARYGVCAKAVTDWSVPFPQRTRLVAMSTVDWTTGDERPWRDVCARARSAAIWTCVDAIQSAGVKESWSPDVDFWASGTQKWLVSGFGLALLAVSDRALSSLEGPWSSAISLREPPRIESGLVDSARRWELGWITPTALLRFRASLHWFERTGWHEVSSRVRARRDRVHERLLEMGYPVISDPVAWSGIVSIDPAPLDAKAIVEAGHRRRIVLGERGGRIRLSPHCFTGSREISRALDWLWRVRSRGIHA